MDPDESDRLPAAGSARVRALALAIAGKEAASKALGTGWSQGVRWRDVVVTREPKPAVRLRGGPPRWLGSEAREAEPGPGSRIEGPLAIGEVWLLR